MSTISKLLEFEEGRYEEPYDDATGKVLHKGDTIQGYITIGIGRCLNTNPLDEEEIQFLFDHELKKTRDELDRSLPWWRTLNEPRQAIILSMAFQLGVHGLMGMNETLKHIQNGQWADAKTHMLNTLWARQTSKRARRHAEQMEKGEWLEIYES
jgi:lysozyme